LVELATRVGAALVGITHFTKGTSGREPTERLTGSLAFGALARVVMVAAKVPGESDDDPPKRVFMRAKSNIGADEGGFEYGLRQVDLDGHPGLSASVIDWLAPIEGTAREVLHEAEANPGEREGSAVTAAAEFLRALLADGPIAASEAEVEAKGAGISGASLRRAKKALGVLVRRKGFGPGSECVWSLPGY
jgi:putative DNA primase/helicase